jgi:Zn-dependent metalloprotease
MKRIVSCIIFIFIASLLNAQTNNAKLAQIAQSGTSTEWVKFKQEKQLDPLKVFSYYKDAFGLSANDAMTLEKQESDKLEYTHYRFQQYYKGIPVRAANYLIHSRNGIAVSGNGKLVKGLTLTVIPQLNIDAAREKAITYTGAQSYMWENAGEEALLKQIKNNPSATYYPEPELMIADLNCDGITANYKLVYCVDIYASKPLSRNFVFVDASTGEVLFTENRLMTTDVPGTAVTKYSGTQTIWTDSVSANVYRLRNVHYGHGVETYNMLKGTNYAAAVDFTDSDNIWNNVNANKDEVATDAHFAAEMTYQYYLQTFGRASYDNDSAKLISYVHYDVNYDNAFWDGTRMTYGDGDGTQYTPFTSLDVGGHEITHAVTEHSANLVYQDESGAMNESFSDIFGTCIEFFGDSAHADWLEGEDIMVNHAGLRSLANPKAMQNPDTYKGQYWVTNPAIDNGGVHTNSGVLNYWFYLLAVGDTGVNDIGHVYDVTGIGRDSAAQIAYRALTVYLTSSSTYADAREAAIQSAEDLYGACSFAVIQTSTAWYAVGIGFPIADNDFQMLNITSPKTACGYSNAEYIFAQLKYNGCSMAIQANDTIPVAYRVDGGAIVNDTVILASTLNGGDTLDFTFAATADFSAIGTHKIDCWVKYAHDGQAANDSIIGYTFKNNIQQNVDVGVSKINGPVSTCHMTNAELVDIDVKFFGCDSLAAGDTIVLAYRVNGGAAIRDTVEIPQTIMPLGTFNHVFSTPVDLSASGNYTIDAWTEYDVDTLNTNDMFAGFAIKNPTDIGFDTIGFEESNINSLILIETTHYSHALISTAAHHTGAKGFQMTGGNAYGDYLDILQFPDGVNTWNINEFLSAKVNFCVDASAWSTLNMRFDLKQTDGGVIYSQVIGPGDYSKASNLRILVNGTQIGGTYNPTTDGSDPWVTHFINLDSYAGQQISVTIETRNIAKDTLGFPLDNAYIDNVCFSPLSQQSVKEYGVSLNMGVYPNPFSDQFTIKFDADKNENVNLVITDMLGRIISKKQWTVDIGSNNININLDDQPAGLYMLKLSSDKGYAVKNIVKQ